MSERHAPGPWRWDGSYLLAADSTIVCDDGSAAGEYNREIDPDGPNGKLIAAAPDLLAVMERCIAVLSTLETPGCIRSGSPSLVKDCRAVVAKAKGATP